MRNLIIIVAMLITCVHGWVGSQATTRRFSPLKVASSETTDFRKQEQAHIPASPLSLTIEELETFLGGKGRAQACWDCLKLGVDPLWYYDKNSSPEENGGILLPQEEATKDNISPLMPTRRKTQGMGGVALKGFKKVFGGSIEDTVANLVHVSTSRDGTIKLLLKMLKDGLEVETVIIPWDDRERSTLCVSSQVGCRQACTFCATGRMGKLRSLSADEILAQVYWAQRACRLQNIFPVDNIVFMGMGEPADNADNVVRACRILTDRQLFQLASRRVTVSTVGPTPESFHSLGKAPIVLAWSVHASHNEVRHELVPTTRYTMEELRDEGLVKALLQRPKRLRTTMLEVTLLDNINDTEEDALDLVNFCQPLLTKVPGIKLVVNLIPWNDIGADIGAAAQYRQPKMERVLAFQRILIEHDVFCYIRTTRGDDESAACGQLATKTKAISSKGT